MLPDGRNLTERVSDKVDGDIRRVVRWLAEVGADLQREAESLAEQDCYRRASDYEIAAAFVLGRVTLSAKRGEFLPKELRPCVDGAGNRGNHRGYVTPDDLCSFCGRP